MEKVLERDLNPVDEETLDGDAAAGDLLAAEQVPLPKNITAAINRLAELFHSDVLFLDANGNIAGSSTPGVEGLPFSLFEGKKFEVALRTPYCFDDMAGEVIICQGKNPENTPAQIGQALVEMVIEQVPRKPRFSLTERNQFKNNFIYRLLHSEVEDEKAIMHYAELLNMDLAPPRAVILLDATDYILGTNGNKTTDATAHAVRRAQFVIDQIARYFHLPDDSICAYLGEGEIAVLKASDSHNLALWASDEDGQDAGNWADLPALRRAVDGMLDRLPISTQNLHVGIGRYHPGLEGLARSYEDARVALSLGRRFRPQESIHCLDELGPAAFIGTNDPEIKNELATHLLSPLDDERELLETLRAFFAEECSISMAASELYIHRNTLGYRLDKIASLTGLDPRRFDDALQIRLAMLLRQLDD